MSTSKDVSTIAPVDHDEAMVLATEEWNRLLTLIDSLTSEEWQRPTDCAGWDVRAVMGHLLGMLALQADPEERARQLKAAAALSARNNTLRIDELTGLQVAEHAALSTAELRAALHRAVPRGLAARRDLPPEVQRAPYDPELPGEGMWTVGYLFDIIHTRDPWLHRVDICRATGRTLELSPEHDGRIVENVVAEWRGKHAQPFELTLTGPAGGRYLAGGGGEQHELDAIEFCRALSGRAPGTGLLTTAVTF
jgi:uncharacterized protein (TIGR03083 family)